MRTQETESIPRAAYSPAEFAAACGRHASWAYRLLYSGKLHAITQLGRLLIPASEMRRILSLAQPYDPKPKPQRQPKQRTAPTPGAIAKRYSDDDRTYAKNEQGEGRDGIS